MIVRALLLVALRLSVVSVNMLMACIRASDQVLNAIAFSMNSRFASIGGLGMIAAAMVNATT